jgi:tetratricopeptide (TPR) repeat protein
LRAVRLKLTEGEISSSYWKHYRGKQGLDCWLKQLEALKHLDRFTIEDNNAARLLIEEAISMCPENPTGYSLLVSVYWYDFLLGKTKSPRETLEKGLELAQKAIAMDDSLSHAHKMLTIIYLGRREYDKAIAEGKRAVALDPGGSGAYFAYASALLTACRPEEAIPLFQKAIRLNPNADAFTYINFAHALRNAGRLEEAVLAYKKGIQRAPDNIIGHIGLGATYSLMGREKEAHAEAQEILRINPMFTVDNLYKTSAWKDVSEVDKVVNALRKAGLK